MRTMMARLGAWFRTRRWSSLRTAIPGKAQAHRATTGRELQGPLRLHRGHRLPHRPGQGAVSRTRPEPLDHRPPVDPDHGAFRVRKELRQTKGARLDPLKSYAAPVASAHMLAWLHAAFSHGVEVERYLDAAEGVLSIQPDRRSWFSELTLTVSAPISSQAAPPSSRPG